MKCPDCNRRGAVLETRQRPDGQVYRRYQCTSDHRWTTLERVEKLPPQHRPRDPITGRFL